MNKKKIYFISALCGLLSFISCQNEEPLDAPVAKDALALLPVETPVGIQAQLKGGFAQGESRTGTSTTATNWYAHMEIHPTKEVQYILYLPGASDPAKTSLRADDVSLESLQNTEPFSTLMLKDFNLTEGGDRCVTRWTALLAYNRGYDELIGFARLKADVQGNPVLDFGELQHANTKVTLVLQDEQGAPILVNDYNQVSAELSLQKSGIIPIYTPEGQTQGVRFTRSFDGLKTLQADETIDPACFGWTVYAHNNIHTYSLYEMCNADDTEEYYGEQNNMLTAIVCPTPTHKDNNDNTFTLLEGGPQLTDDDKLTIEVKEDPDGNGPLTTGKYTLKLKDVKLADGTNLTALKSGEHLTLTVTLQHNMLVQATATIGGWDEVRADVDLNQDPSKMQPYTYDAATNTYTIKDKQGIIGVWNDMQQHTDRATATVMYNSLKLKYVDGAAMGVIDGMCGKETGHSAADEAPVIAKITTAIEAGINNFYVINNLATYDFRWQTKTVVGEAFKYCGADNGSITIMLVDANKVPSQAFMSCKTLNSVSAPNVITIGDEAFQLCSNIASIDFPAATSIGSYAFENCSAIANVSLPLVASIGDYSFQSCNTLTNVSLPKVTKIGQFAFSSCYNLATLSFGSIIESVGNNPFQSVGSSVGGCALTLASGQQHMTTSNPGTPNGTPVTAADANATEEARSWARRTWKSITIKQ